MARESFWNVVYKKNHLAIAICAMSSVAMWTVPCLADDPSTIVIPYSSSGSVTTGDAVNIAFPYTPLGRCVDYTSSDLAWDTAGAISSAGQVSIASVDDDEKRTTEISLGYQAMAKIKGNSFSADSSFEFDTQTEAFRSTDSKTVTVQFAANADYGRYMVQNYKPNPNNPNPITAGADFLRSCGTHFIRGQRRASDLTIFIRVTSSSQAGKDALSASLKHTLGGGISLSALSGDAASTIRASYKSIIEYARNSGSVSVDYGAHGGPGIKAAGEAAKATDATDIAKFGDIVSNVASLFTQDN